MCNLYSITTNREALRRISKAFHDSIGNLPELPGIYPDYFSPIVRIGADGGREIVLARWGLPSLTDAPTDKPNRGSTNIRHPWIDDWRGYLDGNHRCLVPFTRFAEPTKLMDGASGNAWFALDQTQPVAFFAGLWTDWFGTRRKDEGPREHLAFGFFTTKPNDVVKAIHEKAMPVILTEPAEQEAWLTAPWSEARRLQRPLADGALEIVARTALKYLPGVEGIPSGDPLRMAGTTTTAAKPKLL
jgi:putative SOS response-associated peptidase YedK